MKPLSRAGLGLAAGGLNGLVLLAPRLVLQAQWPHPAEAWAVACLCIAVAAETACARLDVRPSTGDLDGLNWAQGLGLLASFEAALWFGQGQGAAPVLCVLGGLILLAGGVLRCLAIRQLGDGFTNTSRPATVTLCVDGVYARLRHPAETGLLLIAAGFPLALGAWTVLPLVFPPLLVLSMLRIRREDRGLARAFPETFERHRKSVPF